MYDFAAEERARQLAYFDNGEAYRTGDVWRWRNNNSEPMADMLAAWLDAGRISQAEMDATLAAREASTRRTLAAYRAARADGPTAGERRAARAAHGPGVKLTNIITGHTWTT